MEIEKRPSSDCLKKKEIDNVPLDHPVVWGFFDFFFLFSFFCMVDSDDSLCFVLF